MTTSTAIPIQAGSQADVAKVELAPEIVPLLSAQLYQSPLKAIEELVVNSYDADAKECFVQIGTEAIAVTDNGIGMDLPSLKNLWHVGRSPKRTEAYKKLVTRTQIGKFGIGKLAAYSIAEVISYYTRTGNDILHATLDFKQFDAHPRAVTVPIYKVPNSTPERNQLFQSLAEITKVKKDFFEGKSWTVCILTQLRPKASQLQLGRLHWVLSTADLPLNFHPAAIRASAVDTPFGAV